MTIMSCAQEILFSLSLIKLRESVWLVYVTKTSNSALIFHMFVITCSVMQIESQKFLENNSASVYIRKVREEMHDIGYGVNSYVEQLS